MDDEKEDSNGKGGPLEPGHQREDSMHSGDFSQLSPSSLGSMEQACHLLPVRIHRTADLLLLLHSSHHATGTQAVNSLAAS